MKKPVKLGLFFLVSIFFYLPASAIVVADYGVATNAPTGEWNVNWDYVYKYKNSSSVAVGSHWLLTAAHVADDTASSTVVVNGTNYYQQEIIFHAAGDDPEHANKADLALVRFDKEFPGYYPLYTGTFPTDPPGPDDNRLNAVLIGYGVTGTVYSTYYTAVHYTDPSKGTKRWGSQKIDYAASADYDIDPTPAVDMTYNDGLAQLFDLGETLYEAGVGTYDSGGGSFVNDGGIWKMAGINTSQYGGPTNFTGTFAVSVPAYETWATNVMNELGDLDGDGIPNYWEQQYGSTTGLATSADDDSDGFTNFEEWIADTDPTDSNTFLEVEGFFALTKTLTFTGSTARQYQVFYTTNDLADPGLTWISNGVPVWGEGSNTTIAVANTEDTVFYRIWVTLP